MYRDIGVQPVVAAKAGSKGGGHVQLGYAARVRVKAIRAHAAADLIAHKEVRKRGVENDVPGRGMGLRCEIGVLRRRQLPAFMVDAVDIDPVAALFAGEKKAVGRVGNDAVRVDAHGHRNGRCADVRENDHIHRLGQGTVRPGAEHGVGALVADRVHEERAVVPPF